MDLIKSIAELAGLLFGMAVIWTFIVSIALAPIALVGYILYRCIYG